MIINDETLKSLGINPSLFGPEQKDKIAEYYNAISNGIKSESLYPSPSKFDSESERIRQRCDKASIIIKKLIEDAKKDVNIIISTCQKNCNMFGVVASAAALDDILLTASFAIQRINETISNALDNVVTLHSSFVALSEIRNDYRLMTLESSLIFYAERLHGISDERYRTALSSFGQSENRLIELADRLYKSASSYEAVLERSFLTSMDRLSIALDFDNDGKQIDVKKVLNQLNIAINILTDAEKI